MRGCMSPTGERSLNLQPQEVILGLFGEYVKPNELAWSGGLVTLLGDLGFLATAARVAMNRVIARDLLKPVKEGRFVHYEITPRLQVILDEGRRRTFPTTADLEWTGLWTLVWYAIPESQRLQRARFGRWLGLRGFGSLQDGTWISPGNSRDDVSALADRLGLTAHVAIFVGDVGKRTDIDLLVNQAWKIDDLRQRFDTFLADFKHYRDPQAISALSDRNAFVLRTKMIEMFRVMRVMDPNIPDDVLGVAWRRREAIETFLALQSQLFPAANRYFRDRAMSGAS